MTDTILLIEDDPFWASLISKMLASAAVHVTRNGVEGLEALERKSFDLVITDLVMPEKDGLAVIADLRKSGSKLPVIAISGGGNVGAQGDLLKIAMHVGATATLAKPFTRDALTAVVEKCLSESATRG
jgi:DNA-binding NtrC family response regulator